MKKIVFVTGSMGRGGAERVISILGDYYISKGWKVYIVMQLHSYVKYDINPLIEIVDASSKKGIKKGFITTIKQIRRAVDQIVPDVIVSFTAQNCLILSLAMKNSNIPIIMSERNDPSQVNTNLLYKMAINHIYSRASKVVFQTERVKQYFPRKVQNNGCIIANPIRVSCSCVEPQNAKNRIVTAGRMVPQKNQKMLISAFSKISKAHPEYTLSIFGDGPLREELVSQAKELHLSDRIEFPGNVPNLHEQIADSQIFVLPSNFEGMSNALLEAMMMGFSVISTDCAGSDEVINDGENGMLIPVNDENALTDKLEMLIEDWILREKLSQNARESVEFCKVENIISQWDSVIMSVLTHERREKK